MIVAMEAAYAVHQEWAEYARRDQRKASHEAGAETNLLVPVQEDPRHAGNTEGTWRLQGTCSAQAGACPYWYVAKILLLIKKYI